MGIDCIQKYHQSRSTVLIVMVVASAVKVVSINNQITYYQSTALSTFYCLELCESGTTTDVGQICCDMFWTVCVYKNQCLRSRINFLEQRLDSPKKILIVGCCITALGLPLGIFLIIKLSKLQQKMVNQLNEGLRNMNSRQSQPVLESSVLSQSLIPRQRKEVCGVCQLEIGQGRVTRLNCRHMCHQTCIQHRGNRCRVCEREQL